MLHSLNAPLCRDLRCKMCNELRLAARPLEKDHEATGNRERQVTAVIVFDQF